MLLCDAFDLDYERAKGVFFREPMFDLNRKWAYFQNGKIESILTTVPLTFGWGNAIGIAGVATKLSSRGQGLAASLLREVQRSSAERAEGPALLFARQTDLYETVGFRVIDKVIRAPIDPADHSTLEGVLGVDEVVDIYNAWSQQDANRLRRDERRWDYWKWNLRVCCPFASGYICIEGNMVRECIMESWVPNWPVHEECEWFGLQSMAENLRIPVRNPEFELHLMGYGFEEAPQMFLTDQF